ncbi:MULTISPECIES: alpha-N-arabinofuranosidase [unclassified Cryobacterium]|uniref:alpha-N-arabinofuranosidase n=1 Tax=unclassified Cryobacterium TaxID=2649013 RepID=UPI00106CE31F|nr:MULTISPECIES: alpha-L-arabinofuranosidase C-terminal domain-containing protein [unclassified Cryobacterium]TFB95247.1 alpha-L-arabinofuranosidase [Cryobacterium sp. MDB2-A-1]TFC11282.1 alpha-L-arabinofuranosidase [Cryobacterium sp. MDB2-A-2]TFC11579.1 alpha-L-arabinofuranosidase [Cryobacterium sp. MDB2-33-2]TFC17474.1 alpha-L-arabinofuranosidase [Cryobacterium sp. MDB2-10]
MLISIDPARTAGTINPAVHGQFIEFLGSCITDGIWVGEDSEIPNIRGFRSAVIDAMKALRPPLVRWPGGCYADTYHWRDGIGPRSERPVGYNENFATFEVDTHEFGTDEFMDFCRLIDAEPWLNINLMSGSTSEMREWMEYCNREGETDAARERATNGSVTPYKVKYWGIGNEVWAGGGFMTPGAYADEYRKFATAMPSFKTSVFDEDHLFRIASGPDGNKPLERVTWTRDFFDRLAEYRQPGIQGYDLHFYNWNLDNPEDTPVDFTEADWNRVIRGSLELEDVILEQGRLIREGLARMPEPESDMDTRLTEVQLVVGEWGNWHRTAFTERPALFQQVTMRDAITTAITLDIFHRNCDLVSMACVAQTVNVLNALIITDGPSTVLTPNYDVFMMYRDHRGAEAADLRLGDGDPDVFSFASVKDGQVVVNLVNASMLLPKTIELEFESAVVATGREVLVAGHPTDHNTPGDPDRVRRATVAVDGTPVSRVSIELPAASVSVLRFSLTA